MPNQATISTTYKDGNGTSIIKAEVVEGDAAVDLEIEIPAGAVNKECTLVLAITTLKSIAMACAKVTGQAGSFTGLTIKTNSSGSPDNTFVITPTNGLCWSAGDPNANPVTVALTKLFVSNAGTAAANLAVRALSDATP